MAKRNPITYRSARRAAWRAIPSATRPTWAAFNSIRPTPNPFHLSSIVPQYRPARARGKQYPAGAEGPVRQAARVAAAKPKRTRKVAS